MIELRGTGVKSQAYCNAFGRGLQRRNSRRVRHVPRLNPNGAAFKRSGTLHGTTCMLNLGTIRDCAGVTHQFSSLERKGHKSTHTSRKLRCRYITIQYRIWYHGLTQFRVSAMRRLLQIVQAKTERCHGDTKATMDCSCSSSGLSSPVAWCLATSTGVDI
jgi:hypothetical protein